MISFETTKSLLTQKKEIIIAETITANKESVYCKETKALGRNKIVVLTTTIKEYEGSNKTNRYMHIKT